MNITFSPEQKITNALMINSGKVTELGLGNGKGGLVLYFYHLSRVTGNKVYEQFAKSLLDDIIESLSLTNGFNFTDGITGIGWLVEYLIQHKFVEADADEILEELDEVIKKQLINEANDIEFLISTAHYLIARIEYRIDSNSEVAVGIRECIEVVVNKMESLFAEHPFSDHIRYVVNKLYVLGMCINTIDKMHYNTISNNSYNYLVPFIPKHSDDEIKDILAVMEPFSIDSNYCLNTILPENEIWGLKKGITGVGLQNILAND